MALGFSRPHSAEEEILREVSLRSSELGDDNGTYLKGFASITCGHLLCTGCGDLGRRKILVLGSTSVLLLVLSPGTRQHEPHLRGSGMCLTDDG